MAFRGRHGTGQVGGGVPESADQAVPPARPRADDRFPTRSLDGIKLAVPRALRIIAPDEQACLPWQLRDHLRRLEHNVRPKRRALAVALRHLRHRGKMLCIDHLPSLRLTAVTGLAHPQFPRLIAAEVGLPAREAGQQLRQQVRQEGFRFGPGTERAPVEHPVAVGPPPAKRALRQMAILGVLQPPLPMPEGVKTGHQLDPVIAGEPVQVPYLVSGQRRGIPPHEFMTGERKGVLGVKLKPLVAPTAEAEDELF